MPERRFLADEWTALSCFRFGIPLPHLSQGVGNDMWGDKVLVQHSSTHTYRHDLMRNEIANACRGIRRFSGHTELRVGPHLYADLTVFAGLGDATFANPLDLDVHIHHLYGQGLLGHLGRDGGSVQALQHLDNAKVAKYGPICSSQGREFLPLGFTVWGGMSSGTHKLLEMVANAAHEHGYVGEVWGSLKGDRIRAMHCFFQGLSFVLNKTVANQLVHAQNNVLSTHLRHPGHARRGQSGRAPTGGLSLIHI